MARRKSKQQEQPPTLERAPGYASDGVSQYSHALAKGHRIGARYGARHTSRELTASERLDRFITHERENVARLSRRLAEAEAEGNPTKIEIASLRLDKTSALLARLLAEKAAT